MNKKVLITILTILGLAVVVSGFWYYLQLRNSANLTQNHQQEKPRRKPELTDQDRAKMQAQIDELRKNPIDTSNWKEYCNQEYGFCVKYPEDWMYKKHYYKNINRSVFNFFDPNCKEESNDECELVSITPYSDPQKKGPNTFLDIDEFEYGGKIPLLKFSKNDFDIIMSYRDNLFEKTRDIYKLTGGSLGYELIIKYKNPNYNPRIERTILESFRLIDKKK